MSSARDYLLGVGRKEPHLIKVPIGGFEYFAIRRTAPQVKAFREGLRIPGTDETDPEKMRHFNERKVIFGIVNPDGTPMFTEADLPALAEKTFNVHVELLAAAVTLQNFVSEEQVEELKKSISPVPPNGSVSSSPASSGGGTSTSSSPKSPSGITKGG